MNGYPQERDSILYAEKFFHIADLALEKKKPILVLKIGKTKVGKKEGRFHSSVPQGSDAVYDAIFRQNGIIRVTEPEELFNTASMLAKTSFLTGNRIGIVSNTIAGAVIILDKLVGLDVVIPELTHDAVQELSNTSDAFGLVKNPLNLTDQIISNNFLFQKCIEVFTSDKNLDAIILIISNLTSEQSKKAAALIVQTSDLLEKPMITWWLNSSLGAPGMAILKESAVTFFTTSEQCVKAIKASLRYSRALENHNNEKNKTISILPPVRRRIEMILENSEHVLTEDIGKEILAACGVAVPLEKLCKNPEEAKKIAGEIGYPVALKVISPQIVHKTDAGTVKLDIENQRELLLAYELVLDNANKHDAKAAIKGVLVQEMVKKGKELIIGILQDVQFGPMIMFGLGGIFVEVLKDFSLYKAPINEREAWEMVRTIKGFSVLEGVRGETSCDLPAIIKVLISVSQLASDFHNSISAVDINPLVVYPNGEGVKALDCLIVKKNE